MSSFCVIFLLFIFVVVGFQTASFDGRVKEILIRLQYVS